MMNFKEKELSLQLFDTLKQHFPDIQLVAIVASPLEESSWRVRIRMPTDEDQEVELREMASTLSTDILLNYGYHILISAVAQSETPRLRRVTPEEFQMESSNPYYPTWGALHAPLPIGTTKSA
jgi:DNA polymerase III sliding clamp (beta) subunit (PCNA family)